MSPAWKREKELSLNLGLLTEYQPLYCKTRAGGNPEQLLQTTSCKLICFILPVLLLNSQGPPPCLPPPVVSRTRLQLPAVSTGLAWSSMLRLPWCDSALVKPKGLYPWTNAHRASRSMWSTDQLWIGYKPGKGRPLVLKWWEYTNCTLAP